MKRIVGIICLVASLLSVTVCTVCAAGTPENSIKTLADLFVIDKADIEKMVVIYPVDGDPAGAFVDKDKFFDIAEKTPLTEKSRIDELDGNDGVWIVAYDKNETRAEIWLDKKARIGCPQREASSAVTTRYEISNDDYIKLYSFLPDEATAHIPLGNPAKKYLWIAIGSGVLVFIIAFAIGMLVKEKGKGV